MSSVNKISSPVDSITTIKKINEIIDNLGGEQIQADWSQTDDSAVDYIKNKPTIPDTSNMVTTDTTQNISGEKTFIGDKKVAFKQSSSSDKLGFTLYDDNNNEKGYLEYNTAIGNRVNGKAILTLGNYAGSSASNVVYTGFRRLSRESGKNGAYNLLTPLIEDAKTPFNLTSDVYENFYFPLGFSDGTNITKASKAGVVDLTELNLGRTTVTFREWS